MAENRKPREIETRQQSVRPEAWKPPELLPEPDKQAGFAYRWIRVSTLNNADPRNLSAKLREGWEPVRAEEQPKFQLLIDPNSRFKDNIEIGGLLLCKTPDEFVRQRNEYYKIQGDQQMEAVDNTLMRQNDPRMPLFNERKTTSSFGKGS
ncbi:MAG: hypothetical protein EHM12_09490 [Dehalococcoidia bacterium]|jgi:hypothetical protein|nr:MAG: hypothetical protein EHM12_09490 [Dehalococcoidia bacterium]